MPAINNIQIIDNLGFQSGKAIDVKGRLSIADLFPKSKKRCGIYLLNFSDDTFYIGQAVDVVRRFVQHRKNYESIERLWFKAVRRSLLDEVEKQMIEEAEALGLLLTNKTFVTNIIGDTDLDLIISPDEQEKWLDSEYQLPTDGFRLYSNVDDRYILKYRKNYEKLNKIAEYEQIKRVLGLYIKSCLPAYNRTELSFWALSCLPSTNRNTYPRFFCLNVNAMEVFVAGYDRKSKDPFSFFILTSLFLKGDDDLKELLDSYKTLYPSISNYRAAGSDQLCFEFGSLDEVENILLNDLAVLNSIKELNLRLMRKGGTIYSPYHCFDLVHDVLSG